MPAPLAYEANFADLPPFPDTVRTAAIQRVSLQALLDGSASETGRLVEACCGQGFFYLDLRGASGPDIPPPAPSVSQPSPAPISGAAYLASASALFGAFAPIFATPARTKTALDFAARGTYYGFKPLGGGVLDATGRRDLSEFFNVSKDDLLDLAAREPSVPAADAFRAGMAEFVVRSHAIVVLLLRRLEEGLGWARGALVQRHRLGERSGDQVRFVRAPGVQSAEEMREIERFEREGGATLGAHTDFGSVTLLHNRLGGLQIRAEGERVGGLDGGGGVWEYVRPLPGHCVVNLGDALVKFSAGRLMSGLHRVVRPPGEQCMLERLSLVYFSRPEDDVLLKPLVHTGEMEDEEVITAKEWTLRRALGRRGIGDWEKSGGTELRKGATRAVAASSS